MNMWADEWGEQREDWSGSGALEKRSVEGGHQLGASLYELGRRPRLARGRRVPRPEAGTGRSRRGIFFIHDVEEVR